MEWPRMKREVLPREQNEGREEMQIESGEKVSLSWKEVKPEKRAEEKEGSEPSTFVFLPGWSLDAKDRSLEPLTKTFANESGVPSYAVSTTIEKQAEDGQAKEVEAIKKFIEERGLKKITLVGHSQGGDRAIDLSVLLSKAEGVSVEGLVLLDAVGLYEQTPGELTKGFAKDSMVNTPISLAMNKKEWVKGIKRGTQVFMDILFNILRDFSSKPSSYISETKEEVAQMARENPNLKHVTAPIIIISGEKDPISDPEKIMPGVYETGVVAKMKNTVSNGEKDTSETKDVLEGKNEYVDEREEWLKEVFPSSPYIRMVVASKVGQHGMPLLRVDTFNDGEVSKVARAAKFLLDRFHRRGETE